MSQSRVTGDASRSRRLRKRNPKPGPWRNMFSLVKKQDGKLTVMLSGCQISGDPRGLSFARLTVKNNESSMQQRLIMGRRKGGLAKGAGCTRWLSVSILR